jgi:hypothetical protein
MILHQLFNGSLNCKRIPFVRGKAKQNNYHLHEATIRSFLFKVLGTTLVAQEKQYKDARYDPEAIC